MGQIRKFDIGSLPGQQQAKLEGCFLYVIEEAGSEYFKIGIAGHPARRLSSLQGGNHRKLAIVAVYQGTRAHCREIELVALRFFRARAGSEWFYASGLGEIVEFLGAFDPQDGHDGTHQDN